MLQSVDDPIAIIFAFELSLFTSYSAIIASTLVAVFTGSTDEKKVRMFFCAIANIATQMNILRSG